MKNVLIFISFLIFGALKSMAQCTQPVPFCNGTPYKSCGTGNFSVQVSATYSGCTDSQLPLANDVKFRWYTNSGSFYTETSVDSGGPGNPSRGVYVSTLRLNSISASTTYYVSTFVGSVESARRAIQFVIEAPLDVTTPPTSTSYNTVCVGQPLRLSGAGSTGSPVSYKWYSALTGGTLLATTSTNYWDIPSLGATTTYYVTAQGTLCPETSPRKPITATALAMPSAPPSTSVDRYLFAPANVTLTASGSPAGVNYEWYNASTGGTLLSTGANYNVYNLTTSSNYYVGTVTTTGGSCKSSTRKKVAVNVYPLPSVVALGSSIIYGSDCPIQLSVSSDYSRYEWYNSKNELKGTSKTLTVYEAGNYYVKVFVGTPEISYASAAFTVNNRFDNPQNTKLNYVVSNIVAMEGVKTICQVNQLNANFLITNIDYIDGLGRSIQKVDYMGSPNRMDVVQPIEYDAYGRIAKEYLPYAASTSDGVFKTAYATEQAAFYSNAANNNADKVVNDAYPFSINQYDNSPLEILTKKYGPGAAWQTGSVDRSVKLVGRPNAASEVRNWVFNHATAVATGTTYHAANSLWAQETTNEEGVKSLTFNDNTGKTILVKKQIGSTSYLETYYVYDDFGQLRYVLPPAFTATTVNPSTDPTVYRLIYAFTYDSRMRVASKRVPGANEVFQVFNSKDQLVLSQDAKQRNTNQWAYFKYDVHGRMVQQGLYNHGSAVSQATMQGLVNAVSTLYEKRAANTAFGYSNNAFPSQSANCEVQNVFYYDDYDFDYNGTADYAYQVQNIYAEGTPTKLTQTLPTGTYCKVLGTANNWLKSVMFYDENKRLIQTQKNNILNLSVLSDVTTFGVNFMGKPVTYRDKHNVGQGDVVVDKSFNYDFASRREISLDNKINNGPWVQLRGIKYNELSNIVEKNLHSENWGSSYLQSIDFTYNIRGKVTNINNASLSSGLSANNNDDVNDLFGMDYLYESTVPAMANVAKFDGNISAIKWKSANTASTALNATRSYRYGYDMQGRLLTAQHGELNTDNTWTYGNKYYEILGYDANGNINYLTRYNGAATLIDNLVYTLQGNQVVKIEDQSNNSSGFNNGVNMATEFSYDANGNLTYDLNRDPGGMTYNHLDLVTTVNRASGAHTDFTYDASGTKLAKLYYAPMSSGLTSSTYYIGAAVYTIAGAGCSSNCSSYFIATEEGRVKPNGSNFNYEYNVKDHLGNVHLSFDKHPTTGLARIIQEDHYYPFGMKLDGLSYDNASGNKYLFNGKELQTEIGNLYDFGARLYDPVLGRWGGVDPLAIKYHKVSPYNYCLDNPVRFKDPDGRSVGVGNIGNVTPPPPPVAPPKNNLVTNPPVSESKSNSGPSGPVQLPAPPAGSGTSAPPAGGGAPAGGSGGAGMPVTQPPVKEAPKDVNSGPVVMTPPGERDVAQNDHNIGDFGGVSNNIQLTGDLGLNFIPTVINNTKFSIWVKAEDNNIKEPIEILPGEMIYIKIDGVTHPSVYGKVFKVRDVLGPFFGVYVDSDGVNLGRDVIATDVNDMIGGGWLDKEPDDLWNRIFQKSRGED